MRFFSSDFVNTHWPGAYAIIFGMSVFAFAQIARALVAIHPGMVYFGTVGVIFFLLYFTGMLVHDSLGNDASHDGRPISLRARWLCATFCVAVMLGAALAAWYVSF
jgi:hypothetical protein